MAKPPVKTVVEIRAEREGVHGRINALRDQAKALSAQIREMEGPIPDRDGRPAKDAGYTIAPVKG